MVGLLSGIRIIEVGGIGPGPFASMMLADHGADVISIQRRGGYFVPQDASSRSRRSIVLDFKRPGGVEAMRALCRTADGLIEGFRPGVMERLGLGPEVLLADNPRLVYGRMTGWGQFGPLANSAGHDINYIAITGVLHAVGRRGEPPVPPVNFVGDFGGGGMLLAFGMAAALLGVRMGKPGQVVDAAMTDGSALLAAMCYWGLAAGTYHDERGTNWCDGGSHYYDTYECADGGYISIASWEPQFYALLREKLGIAGDPEFDAQQEEARWPDLKLKLAAIFRQRTREEWCGLLEGSDVCFAPVLSMSEAPFHPHNIARQTFVAVDGVIQPAPAPRFSATPAPGPRAAPQIGADGEQILREAGFSAERIAALRDSGALA
ncbi:MAG TPA: CaiB/BaiF CoA-transferase family protein [Novosphingobium sp.]|nr:CaiB/BaiF CoA-transferase family protein [Novosphingobium sp.]